MTFESVNMTLDSVNMTTLESVKTALEGVYNEDLGKEIVDWLKFIGITFGFSILGGLAAIAIFYLVLCVLGFTCCGIMAGSSAAHYQSSIGDVEAGSCFACCQSAGAGGMACCFNILLFFVGFFLTGTLLVLDQRNYDQGGSNNSTMNATLVMADLAMNSTVLFMNKTMNATSLLMNSSMVYSL